MQIRTERISDQSDIHALTKAAFDPMPFSDGTEAECIDKLREDGDLLLSLVAIVDSLVVGHIAFSPITVSKSQEQWIGLGPVSVHPDRQRQGIGGALINAGLRYFQDKDFVGCILIGDPTYYSKFGFLGDGRISYRDLPCEVVQWLGFAAKKPAGVVKFSSGLE